MKSLIIVNDAPYGNERCYNALRVAQALLQLDDAQVSVFLMADAVAAAVAGQMTPEGYYNIERMLKRIMLAKGEVMLCGTCMDARAIAKEHIVDGARPSNMVELAAAIANSDRVLTF